MGILRKIIRRRKAASDRYPDYEPPYNLVFELLTSINDGNTVDVKVGYVTVQGDPIPNLSITGDFAMRNGGEVWFTGRSNYATQSSYTPTVTASNGVEPDATLQITVPVAQAGNYDGPVPNTVVASANWQGVTGDPDYNNHLAWVSRSRQYPPSKVLTPSNDVQVDGASNGYAWEVTTVRPTQAEKDALNNNGTEIDKKYTRMELYTGGYPSPLDGAGGNGWSSGFHTRLGQRFIVNYRIKIAKEWQIDTIGTDKLGDRNTSLFEFKQDYGSGADFIRRDSTFRLRINGTWGTFKVEGCTAYKKTLDNHGGTKFTRMDRVDLSNLFDNQWHQFTIDAKFTNAKDANGNPLGFIKVYLDNILIYTDDDTNKEGNCWNDDEVYGPYFKCGQYNSWWRETDLDTGSEFHRHLVDFIRVGVPT